MGANLLCIIVSRLSHDRESVISNFSTYWSVYFVSVSNPNLGWVMCIRWAIVHHNIDEKNGLTPTNASCSVSLPWNANPSNSVLLMAAARLMMSLVKPVYTGNKRTHMYKKLRS